MVLRLLAITFMFCLCSCDQNIKKTSTVEIENIDKKTTISVYDFKKFEPLLHKKNDTTYVINFWATWCKPCVKELPYFEELHSNYKDENVKVILVSLDMESQIDSKLKPFIEKNNIKSKLILLDDPDANAWISKIDSTWSGAIPATLIYKNQKKKFYEKSFNYESLEKALKNL